MTIPAANPRRIRLARKLTGSSSALAMTKDITTTTSSDSSAWAVDTKARETQ